MTLIDTLGHSESNILGALRNCVAFITVMHPRGKIVRPNGSEHIRASVWIEQEIAIATYIQRVEKRPLPVIAFVHESVGHEGIRDLLHLNPIPFSDESEILVALPLRLLPWKGLPATGIRVQLQSGRQTLQDGHRVRQLVIRLVNDSSQRITELDCEVRLPAGILKHWSSTYPSEVKSDDTRHRHFRISESSNGPIQPRDIRHLLTFDYCTKCALDDAGGIGSLVSQATVEAKVWINGREYTDEKTIQQLAEDAEARGQH